MPMPVSLTATSMCELTRSRRTCTRPPRGVNFTALDNRFQTTCCSQSGSPDDRTDAPDRRWSGAARLSHRRRAERRHGVVHDQRQFHRLHVEPDLAGDDARHFEHVLDDARERRRVALERLQAALGLLAREDAAAQQPCVADDGVQGRAQLVREDGEEFVLHPIRVTRLCIKVRVLQRDRRPRGDSDHHLARGAR